ncbi:MAG: helix-turn-helix domain-containing protein [Anaerolineales bacterium]|jgi:transcriptional regulator with XRE-family HTH domain
MSIQAQVNLRSRKLGVLIRDARLSERKTIQECARAVGVTPGIFRAWEEGRRSPSLPELEVLAYSMHLPLNRFWSKDAKSEDTQKNEALNLPAFVSIRQRLIGALLRQAREKANISPHALSEMSGISAPRIKAYELGERSIPLPELEGLTSLLGTQIEMLFDQTGHIGLWMVQQKAIQEFLTLPNDLQNFVSKPVNRPYLELAKKLSGMSTDKLRSLAEDILEITF